MLTNHYRNMNLSITKSIVCVFMLICFFIFNSCESKPKDTRFKIYHLQPDEIIVETDTIGKKGWFNKRRTDFFAVKNYNATEQHKLKIDSFVVAYLKQDNFLFENENVNWKLVFFHYSDGINEQTKHQNNTDYTIHDLFSYKKEICGYYFDTRGDEYKDTYFRVPENPSKTTKEKRSLVETYFKTIPTDLDDSDELLEDDSKNSESVSFSELINTIPTKELPLIDTTNFDDFIEAEDFKNIDPMTLKLVSIYPDFEKHGFNAIAAYKIELSDDYYTLVITIKKGDNEMESRLVNYTLSGDIIDHKIVAYDEIAESMFRTESKLSHNEIVVNKTEWLEDPIIKQFTYQIVEDGTINEIDSRVLNDELSNLPVIKIALDRLGLNIFNVKTDYVTITNHPDNPDDFIIVLPEVVEEADDYFKLNNHIVIVNGSSGELMQKYNDKGLTSDAIEISNISIDTARYMVAENQRAFGVRVSYRNNSQPNPYNNETLSLFVKSGDALHTILKHYNAKEYTGEWDTRCAGEFTDVKNTFIMSKEKTNGYFNVVVKSDETYTHSFLDKNGECIATEKLSTKETVLKFNGKVYQ